MYSVQGEVIGFGACPVARSMGGNHLRRMSYSTGHKGGSAWRVCRTADVVCTSRRASRSALAQVPGTYRVLRVKLILQKPLSLLIYGISTTTTTTRFLLLLPTLKRYIQSSCACPLPSSRHATSLFHLYLCLPWSLIEWRLPTGVDCSPQFRPLTPASSFEHVHTRSLYTCTHTQANERTNHDRYPLADGQDAPVCFAQRSLVGVWMIALFTRPIP